MVGRNQGKFDRTANRHPLARRTREPDMMQGIVRLRSTWCNFASDFKITSHREFTVVLLRMSGGRLC